ncbi:autotransporter outer membrane beta-barrel domain-containing protein [Martelella sp. HB161492]|uniref:autotransporter outer membrane beta-barrel domain-containing protein n=1 Tax=Martelella sp. HB161492 TaxID=2720726 RepID=UPI00159104E4|nr:autotransporter outer membrane beta-barrel domain-containing protein [Martelella sp. HB161492]
MTLNLTNMNTSLNGPQYNTAFLVGGEDLGAGSRTITVSDSVITLGSSDPIAGQTILKTVTSDISTGLDRAVIVIGKGSELTAFGPDATIGIAEAYGDSSAEVDLNGGSVVLEGDSPVTDPTTGSALIANALGTGSAYVSMTDGLVVTKGDNSSGLVSSTSKQSRTGATSRIDFSGGSIETQGDGSNGAFAVVSGKGDAVIVMGDASADATGSAASVSTKGDSSAGLYARATGQSNAWIGLVSGTVTTLGENSTGIRSAIEDSKDDGDAFIHITGGSVVTYGDSQSANGGGAYGASAYNLGSGDAAIAMDGPDGSIRTSGKNSDGLFALTNGGGVAKVLMRGGSVETYGDGANGISATSSGNLGLALVSMSGGSIKTTGNGSNGIYAEASGLGSIEIDLQGDAQNDGVIETEGDDAAAVYALHKGASGIKIKAPQLNIKTEGEHSAGIKADAGSYNPIDAQLAGVMIETQGDQSSAIALSNTGGDVNLSIGRNDQGGVADIRTSGAQSHGVDVNTDDHGIAYVTMDGGSIATSGDGADGIHVTHDGRGNGGMVEIDFLDGSISTQGAGADGISFVSNDSAGIDAITVGDYGGQGTPKVTVSGAGSFALTGYGDTNDRPNMTSSTSIFVNSGEVIATGEAQAAVGFRQTPVGSTALNATVAVGPNGTIDGSTSTHHFAIWNGAERADSLITVSTSGTIKGDSMLGAGNSQFFLRDGIVTGNIYADYDPNDTGSHDQGDDTFYWYSGQLHGNYYGQGGNDTAYVYVGNVDGFSDVIFDGGEDEDAGGNAASGRSNSDVDAITFTSTVNDGLVGAHIINWEKFTADNADLTFTDNGLVLDGYAGGNPNGFGDFTLKNNSIVQVGKAGDFDLVGNVNIADAGSAFISVGSGRTRVSGDVSNNGILSMQDGSADGRLAVGGNYSAKGGRLAVDVDFGASKSDLTTIGGSIDGDTTIEVADLGAAAKPAPVLLVNHADNSNVDSSHFSLGYKGEIASGKYSYVLSNDAGKGFDPGLYLVSEQGDGGDGDGGGGDSGGGGDNGGNGGGGNGGGGGQPALQPFLPVYEAYMPILMEMSRLPTLRQRTGQRQGYEMAGAVDPGTLPASDGIWLRMVGGRSHVNPASSVTGYDYDLSQFETQLGVDGLFYDGAEGVLRAGVTGQYRLATGRIGSKYGAGDMLPSGYGVGGNLTWYGTNGFYADAQTETTFYTSNLKTDDLSRHVNGTDATAIAFSLEAGQQFDLDSGFALTPQGQLSYTNVNADDFTGAYNDSVDFKNAESLLARMGVSLEKSNVWKDDGGFARSTNVYGIANLYYEFLGDSEAVLVDMPSVSKPNRWTGEVGLGTSYNWKTENVDYALYAEVRASSALADFGNSYGLGANIGLKLRW